MIPQEGSPPRVRGKGASGADATRWIRITPACAGKRAPACCRPPYRWDHPRVCGEKQRTLAVQDEPQGSPPRMRGKAFQLFFGLVSDGITPAYAGKSLLAADYHPTLRDHPRVCGEKTLYNGIRLVVLGSPPRMRGKVTFASGCSYAVGITPAYAGKSKHSSPRSTNL